MLLIMNTPLNCDAQDMLEAAIVQRRRLDIIHQEIDGEIMTYTKVLPIDVNSYQGIEKLTILTSDNQGGILKRVLNTADIHSFEAKDFKDPRILYHKKNATFCAHKEP